MLFVLDLTCLLISYGVAYFLSRRFRHLIPKGKEFEVGMACSLSILIVFMTKTFWFSSDENNLYIAIGVGLASGVTSSITGYGLKISKRRR